MKNMVMGGGDGDAKGTFKEWLYTSYWKHDPV